MADTDQSADGCITRRQVLQGAGVALGATTVATVPATADESGGLHEKNCSESTLRPGMIALDGSIHDVCADDHQATQTLQSEVQTVLEEDYPTVGALLDTGYIPYFDFFTDHPWAHWLNPEFVGSDDVMDPAQPASILVDNTWWRPIGVMFIATEDGEPVAPPAVYEDEETGACKPWHAHVGFPGRYAWWKYRAVYDERVPFPCRTPWMMHVWRYPHEKTIYAHDAPEDRGGPPAERPGFDTDADPTQEELGVKHLPDAVKHRASELWERSGTFW